MAISVGLGAVAVKNGVDSYPGLGREAVRVAQIVGPEGRFPYLDATFDVAPDERADPGRRGIVTTCGSACHATCWSPPDSSCRSMSASFSNLARHSPRRTLGPPPGREPCLGVVDLRELGFCAGVRRLRQGGKNIRADVEPAPLLASVGEHLPQGLPEPQRPVSGTANTGAVIRRRQDRSRSAHDCDDSRNPRQPMLLRSDECFSRSASSNPYSCLAAPVSARPASSDSSADTAGRPVPVPRRP